MKKLIISLQNIYSLCWQDLINLYHIADRFSSKEKRIIDQAKTLRKDGIICIPNFISAELCDKIYAEALPFLSQQKQTALLPSGTYIDYRSSNNASGPDAGMIDVAHIDREIASVRSIDLTLSHEIMRQLSSMQLYLSQINLYYNKNVPGTRIDHVDNCQPIIYKGFIYLTDVEDASYGPYSFMPGTQRFSPRVYFNLVANIFRKKYRSTDMPDSNPTKRVVATGKKGTLVLSNQNGIHRGLTQTEGRERMAIIVNYLVLSKANYKHKTIRKVLEQAQKLN